jgi:hypothetical protein
MESLPMQSILLEAVDDPRRDPMEPHQGALGARQGQQSRAGAWRGCVGGDQTS